MFCVLLIHASQSALIWVAFWDCSLGVGQALLGSLCLVLTCYLLWPPTNSFSHGVPAWSSLKAVLVKLIEVGIRVHPGWMVLNGGRSIRWTLFGDSGLELVLGSTWPRGWAACACHSIWFKVRLLRWIFRSNQMECSIGMNKIDGLLLRRTAE